MPGSCNRETECPHQSAKLLMLSGLAFYCLLLPTASAQERSVGGRVLPVLAAPSNSVLVLPSGPQSTVDSTVSTADSCPEVNQTPTIVVPPDAPSGLLIPVRLAQIPGGVPLSPTVIPAQTQLQIICPRRNHFRGFWGRLTKPIFGPLVDGMDDTACGLNGTTAGLHSLWGPLESLGAPLNDLAEPLSGLAQPLTGLANPLTGLAQPINNLAQPLTGLQPPVSQLSHSVSGLDQPLQGLGDDIVRLREPLTGIQQPLVGIQEPLSALPGPLTGLVEPLRGLQEPLVGLRQPLNGLARPIRGLQSEMHSLRGQISRLEMTIMDIGRNVTLAIVFGCSIIAYAIWTHRRVPSAVEPTVTTMHTAHVHDQQGGDHHSTIIKTGPVAKPGSPANSADVTPESPGGHEQGHQPPDDQHGGGPPEPPPSNIINPPGE
jgi:hypothetical protein